MSPGTKVLLDGAVCTVLPHRGEGLKLWTPTGIRTVKRMLISPVVGKVNGKREHNSPGEGNVIRGAA